MIHSQIKTVADAICSTSKSIEGNGRLAMFLPDLFGEFSVALSMTEKELNLYCIDVEYGSCE